MQAATRSVERWEKREPKVDAWATQNFFIFTNRFIFQSGRFEREVQKFAIRPPTPSHALPPPLPTSLSRVVHLLQFDKPTLTQHCHPKSIFYIRVYSGNTRI